SQAIIINDTISPAISGLIEGIALEGCSAEDVPEAVSTVAELQLMGLIVADNCTASEDLVVTSEDIVEGSCPISVTRTYTITDACGNSATATQSIEIEDSTPPENNCSNLTVYTNENGEYELTQADIDAIAANITDNCTDQDELEITVSQQTFGCADIGQGVAVTVTATDLCGNSSTCETIVTVTDTIAPVANCNDFTIQLNADGFAEITVEDIDNLSTDNCGIDTMWLDQSTFSCENVGENIITLTVADASGNQSTCQSTVTVADSIAPTINCNDFTVQLNADGLAEISIEDVDNLSTDNCSIDTMYLDTYNFTCENVGENTVTLTVIDASGNISTCESIVTVEEGDATCFNQPPVAENDSVLVGNCTTTIINVLANDSDPDGDELTNPVIITDVTSGTLTVNEDGTIEYEPETNFVGVVTFIYEICDSPDTETQLCDQAEVTITVDVDTDCDGIANTDDIDDDNDGILDIDEGFTDFDGDGIPNHLDIDSDNDGILDNIEGQPEGQHIDPVWSDTDGDGWDDAYDPDNGGTYFDLADTDEDGTPDFLDLDSDDDGNPDEIEGFDVTGPDNEPDSIADIDPIGIDSDNDGEDDGFDTIDGWENFDNPIGGNAPLPDYDGDGARDWRDADDGKPEVGGDDPLQPFFIPEGYSPNDDGINDYFKINGMAQFPNASIEIYNRWGNMIYEKEDYGNESTWGTSDAWWDGRSNTKWTVGKEKLPPGTYFYILHLNNGDDPITGSVFLNR
ncbi:MAG TPA: gliding motility-associated C-terminal domain-containing protein, partial [Tangfeifania sp.]|nr:gliding motility-associated C-terminal domain-containing protein [Tangfeifania sp.]